MTPGPKAKRAKPTAETHAAEHAEHATVRPCPRCGADTITARVGQVAALDVRADTTALTPIEEIQARLDGRLTWCLAARPHVPARLRQRGPEHIASGRCTHTVHADHQCPPHPVQETLL